MTEFIINPVSGKPIKRGGTTYIQLLQQGIRFGNSDDQKFKTDKIICEIEGKSVEELDTIKRNFNDTNEHYCAIRGRGHLSKYLVKKRRKQSYNTFGLELARRAAPKIVNYFNNIEELGDISIENSIARIIDHEAQRLSKSFNNSAKFFILKDNIGEPTEHTND